MKALTLGNLIPLYDKDSFWQESVPDRRTRCCRGLVPKITTPLFLSLLFSLGNTSNVRPSSWSYNTKSYVMHLTTAGLTLSLHMYAGGGLAVLPYCGLFLLRAIREWYDGKCEWEHSRFYWKNWKRDTANDHLHYLLNMEIVQSYKYQKAILKKCLSSTKRYYIFMDIKQKSRRSSRFVFWEPHVLKWEVITCNLIV